MTPGPDAALPAPPRYGTAALSDVLPSVLAALGVPGEANPLGLAATQRACVLLVDGMGANLLARHASAAPFLASADPRTLTAGFPSTTVTSLASLGTGLPPGRHGLPGYTSYEPEVADAVNWLAWRPVGRSEDLREQLVPEVVQPEPTVFERAAEAGVTVSCVLPRDFGGSGLTRAVLRGGRFEGTFTSGDVVASAAQALDRGHRSLVYTYMGDLDLVGHVRGPATDHWLAQLSLVDAFVARLVERLPRGTMLLVTADHGMVAVAEEMRVDLDRTPQLTEGLVGIGGEPRVRYAHTRPGAADDVLATWRSVLGEVMWVLSREEAVAAGLFGPEVTPAAAARIGDVVAIARGAATLVRSSAESRLSALPGQHGALDGDELLVPLLEWRS